MITILVAAGGAGCTTSKAVAFARQFICNLAAVDGE